MIFFPRETFWIVMVFIYCFCCIAIFTYGLHRFVLTFCAWKTRKTNPIEPNQLKALPIVTVQLPLYNENNVAERLIRAISKFDYPKEKLQIQVLDDSEDQTQKIVQEVVKDLKDHGLWIELLHRTMRTGYKAGALAEGLKKAKGEFIAIFDADFLPNPDFLKRSLPHFHSSKIAMVQAKWDFLNRNESILTKVQALFLDGHFYIEHFVRHRLGLFFNFNGTAGIWKKQAIIDAGGWSADTLTEDLDLSYRTQLKGYRFVFMEDVKVASELPGDILSFKGQQYRWAKGSIQTARKLLPLILTSPISKKIKIEAFFHLTDNFAYLFLLTAVLFTGPIFHFSSHLSFFQTFTHIGVFLFWSATLFFCAFYLFVMKIQKYTLPQALLTLPCLMVVGLSLCINNTLAISSAWNGKKSEFIRTPKKGTLTSSFFYRPPKSSSLLMETFCALYTLFLAFLSLIHPSFFPTGFFLFFSFGFLYATGLLSQQKEVPIFLKEEAVE